MKFLAIILAALASTYASGAGAASIMVEYSGEDIVGQRIAYDLREQISRSQRHKLVYSREQAGFVLRIVTVENTRNVSTSYAAALTMPPFDKKGYDYFITMFAGNCGSSRISECSLNILSGFDEEMNSIVSAMREALKAAK